jgi:hypothetical protein
MGPIKRIKQRTRGARSIKFRQALKYGGHPAGAIDAVRVAPDVYAALAERVLYWTGDVLTAIHEAAGRREPLRPTAAKLLELIAEYFDHPERWPDGSSAIGEPVRLCVPACFALHAIEPFNSAAKPALARFGSDNAHALYRELLGTGITKPVAAAAGAAIAPLLPIVRSTGGAAGEAKPIDLTEPPLFGAELRRQWRQALARATASAPAPAPVQALAPRPEVSPRSEWQSRLEGARLSASGDSLRDSDYSGGGYFLWRERVINLHRTGSFVLRETSRMRVTAGGMSGTTESQDEQRGTWKISHLSKGPLLELHGTDGRTRLFWLADGGSGLVRLDGKPYLISR